LKQMGANISSMEENPGLLWTPSSSEELDFVVEEEHLETSHGTFEFVEDVLQLDMSRKYDHAWHSGSIAIPQKAQMASRVIIDFKIDGYLRPNGWYCNLYFEERAHGRIAALVCKFDCSSLKLYDLMDSLPSRGIAPDSQFNAGFTKDVDIVAGRWEEFDVRIDWPEQKVVFYVSNRKAGTVAFNTDPGIWHKLVAVQVSGYAKGGTSYWKNLRLSTLTDSTLDVAERLLEEANALQLDHNALTRTIMEEAAEKKFLPPSDHPAFSDLLDLIKVADSQINLQQVTHALKEAVLILLQKLDQMFAAYIAATADADVRDKMKEQLLPMLGRYARGYNWAYKDLVCWNDEEALANYLKFANAQKAKVIEEYSSAKPTQRSNDLLEISIWSSAVQPRVTLVCKHLADKFGGQHLSGASVKSLFRSHEKITFSNDMEPENLADIARGGVQFSSVEQIHDALKWFSSGGEKGNNDMGVTVVRIKNRFGEASVGGWRDALINFFFTDDTSRRVVVEIQVMHSHLLTIREHMGAHHDYSTYRAATDLMEHHGDSIKNIK